MAGETERQGRGRGRLSSFELLPEPCTPVVVWASDELRKRQRTQTDIYEEFCDRLEAVAKEFGDQLEFTIPSFTAFNRLSLRLAMLSRRMEDMRVVGDSMARNRDNESPDNLTLVAAEAIKTLVFELLIDAGESGIDARGAKDLANALRAATQAEDVSATRRREVQKEFAGQVDEAVDKVAKVKGLTAETVQQIKEQILGVAT